MRSSRSISLLAIGLAVLAPALASGCGGGGGAAAEETVPPLTKGQLTHKMGVICQEHTDRQVVAIKKFEKKHHYPASSQEKVPAHQLEQELTVVILPIVRDTIHDLRQLNPSQKQKATFEEFIASLEHGVDYSEKDPSWLPTGSEEPFSEARELSWKLGTALCGQA